MQIGNDEGRFFRNDLCQPFGAVGRGNDAVAFHRKVQHQQVSADLRDFDDQYFHNHSDLPDWWRGETTREMAAPTDEQLKQYSQKIKIAQRSLSLSEDECYNSDYAGARPPTETIILPHVILIVEDHADTRDGLAQLLQLSGYSVLTAADGQQGLTTACAQAPDLILTDILMPVMDGIQMIKQLRTTPVCKTMPILVLSAYGEKALEAARAGANEVLGKPVNISDLLQAIESLV